MLKIEFWQTLSGSKKIELIDEYSKKRNDITDEEIEKMKNSLRLFNGFISQAHEVAKVRTHYSAQTIIEVLRHHSMLSDDSVDFKISNDICAPLARVSMDMFPALNGLFQVNNRLKFKKNRGE